MLPPPLAHTVAKQGQKVVAWWRLPRTRMLKDAEPAPSASSQRYLLVAFSAPVGKMRAHSIT